MPDEKSRILKVLEALSQCVDPAKPADIGNMIGETPFNTGHDLFELEKTEMAQKPDKKKSLYLITDSGRETLKNPPNKWIYKSRRETPPPVSPPVSPPEKITVPSQAEPKPTPTEPTEVSDAVPSQADLFTGIGERLGVGGRKGDVKLEAIIYYVQRTANLDNLSSVWNALTEMGVASDVKKRWIKLYAQNLPGKEIPEELKKKLEGGLEPEKVKVEAGEIPPKPNRFSVVGGEIIGDPEGDYNFKEALQYFAQQRGVPSAQADPLASMVEAMKMGPEMATATLTTMIPLITKEPKQPDNTLSQALQALREAGVLGKQEGTEGGLLAQLNSLGLLKKSGEEGGSSQIDMLTQLNQLGLLKTPGGEGEGSRITALMQEFKEFKETVQKQETDNLKGAVASLSNQMTELRKEIANGGKLEGRYALMEKTIATIDNQLTGIRSDAKPLLASIGGGGGGPAKRSPEEKAKVARGLKEAVALEKEAKALEDELLFGGKQG